MTFGKAVRFIHKRGWDDWPEGLFFGLQQRASRQVQQRLNFWGEHEFVDRSSGQDSVLVVLAGYKQYLWPFTLHRLERFVPPGIDVVLVSPAVRSQPLDELAAQMGWSRLITKANSVALAQNVAIDKHPHAKLIYKLDEDMFISSGYFAGLRDALDHVKQEKAYEPGLCAPIVNVNGFTYVDFLETMGLAEDYGRRFGELRRAADGVRVQHDGDAARWLWERSVPFDEVARRFSSKDFGYSVCPHRFSIGAILYERTLWEAMGGFKVTLPPGILGVDEEYLCFKCLDMSRVMVAAHNVFAGHFGFGAQEATMRRALGSLEAGLVVNSP